MTVFKFRQGTYCMLEAREGYEESISLLFSYALNQPANTR